MSLWVPLNAADDVPHLLGSPPPLSRRIRLLHLDQDVLLGAEVNSTPYERPAHLQLQQSVIAKVRQVHRCETRTVKRKRRHLFGAFHFEDEWAQREGYRTCPWRRQPASSRGCLDLDTCCRRAETQSCSLLTHSCMCVCVSQAFCCEVRTFGVVTTTWKACLRVKNLGLRLELGLGWVQGGRVG